jgi:hypothetical protein
LIWYRGNRGGGLPGGVFGAGDLPWFTGGNRVIRHAVSNASTIVRYIEYVEQSGNHNDDQDE